MSSAHTGPRASSGPVGDDALRDLLRLVVITDARSAAPRTVESVVEAALRAGARAIQLRVKDARAREVWTLGQGLRALTQGFGALLFVNDRLDVALSIDADGVHLGPDDVPMAAARLATPVGFLIGYSTDDPDEARRAEAEGADYLGCGSVWTTLTKDTGGEAIGLERLDAVARAVRIPVVAIGGVTPSRAREVAATSATGIAVVGAVMGAPDPGAAVRALMEPFLERRTEGR